MSSQDRVSARTPPSSSGAQANGILHDDHSAAPLKTRVVFVGVGGATCSGKTTLAKHLRAILPDSHIVHQDDFAPLAEKIPIHPKYDVQDWDTPRTAIDYPRLVSFLKHLQETGEVHPDHRSHDHLNEQREVPLPHEVVERWSAEFRRVRDERAREGERIIWALVDGFLLYWDQEVVDRLDVRVFLRVSHDVLEKRRYARHGWHTQAGSDPEGLLWRDPPGYWEHIVYPAYIEANQHIFEGGDVEHGKPKCGGFAEGETKVDGLVVLEALEMGMGDLVERCCELMRAQI